jgi:hypothetical protein
VATLPSFSEVPAMRALAICLALFIATPAFAQQPYQALYDFYKEQREKKAARLAEHKALCAKVGGVRIGLNSVGILKSCWGKPQKVNETTTASHSYEQWVYSSSDYLYLTDGIVTSIQTSR